MTETPFTVVPYLPVDTNTEATPAAPAASEEQEAETMAIVLDALGLDEPPAAPVVVPIIPTFTRRRLPKPVLPAVDRPAIEAPRVAKSYKVPFQQGQDAGWNLSRDGGKNHEQTKLQWISGAPLDLTLAITPANWQKGAYDWRLSLEFADEAGELCEINLNALRPSKDDPGQLVLTGPARSLLGSLLAITDEDNQECDGNMAAFAAGARFTLKKGNVPKSQFIEVAICKMDPNTEQLEWEGFSSPKYTSRVRNSPAGLIQAIESIKFTLRLRNYLSPTPAVTGKEHVEATLNEGNEDFTVVPVESTVIND